MTTDEILDELELIFPNAECELIHKNAYELLIAVILSAQTTDVSVNKITPALFERFPTPQLLAKAELSEIEPYIHSIGLYRNKARSIKGCAAALVEKHQGIVPSTMKELTALPGCGRKTANVMLSVAFDVPAIAVDTHVERVSKRLGLAKPDDSVLEVEKKLKRKIKRERWNKSHHLFIFFGRYLCMARNPQCERCPFQSICKRKKIEAVS